MTVIVSVRFFFFAFLLKAAKSRSKTTAKRRNALQQKVAAKAPAGRPKKRAKLQESPSVALDGAMRALVV